MASFTLQYSSLGSGFLSDPARLIDDTLEETDTYNWQPLGKTPLNYFHSFNLF